METKYFSHVELKADGNSGEFTALISTFGVPDKYGDIVRRGAFRDTIAAWRTKGAKVPVVYSHRSDDIEQHIGEVDPADLQETSRGLQARGRLYLDEDIGAKVHRQLRRKALSEWSFAYTVQRARKLAEGGRELLAVTLLELGPCLAGAGQTETLDVKSLDASGPTPLDRRRARLHMQSRRFDFDVRLVRAVGDARMTR